MVSPDDFTQVVQRMPRGSLLTMFHTHVISGLLVSAVCKQVGKGKLLQTLPRADKIGPVQSTRLFLAFTIRRRHLLQKSRGAI
jgi:hypothetical protein